MLRVFFEMEKGVLSRVQFMWRRGLLVKGDCVWPRHLLRGFQNVLLLLQLALVQLIEPIVVLYLFDNLLVLSEHDEFSIFCST